MLEKCVLTILELNWNQLLGHKKAKLNICHHMLTSSHTPAKQDISRRRKNKNVFKMSKDEKSKKTWLLLSMQKMNAMVMFYPSSCAFCLRSPWIRLSCCVV